MVATAQLLPGVMLGSPEAWNKGSDTRIVVALRAGSLGLSTSSQYVSPGAGPGEAEGMRPGGGMKTSRAWAGGSARGQDPRGGALQGGLAEDLKLRWLPGEGGEQGTGRGRSRSQRLKSQGISPPRPTQSACQGQLGGRAWGRASCIQAGPEGAGPRGAGCVLGKLGHLLGNSPPKAPGSESSTSHQRSLSSNYNLLLGVLRSVPGNLG